jgi:N-acetylneuraminic acid mutarotase
MALPAHHVALAELGGKIYVFGGFTLAPSGPPSWMPIGNAWEYDPVHDSWKPLRPMPTKRGAAAAAVVGGKIYVIGGAAIPSGVTALTPSSPQAVVATVEEYDVATDTWRTRASMPTPRNHHALGAVNGKIYAIGGRVGSVFIPWSNSLDLVEVYDPAQDRWGGELERMPTPRSGPAWGVHNGRIYVAGGEYQDKRLLAAFRSVESYEPSTNRWSVLPSMPNPRHGAAGGIIADRFYVVGGETQSGGSGVRGETAFNQALRLDQLPQ